MLVLPTWGLGGFCLCCHMGEEDLGVRDQRTEQTNKFKQDDGDDFSIEYGDDGLH